MSTSELSLRQRILNQKKLSVGGILLVVGFVALLWSLFPSLEARVADYAKDAGFMFAATGFGFLLAEHMLRRDSEALLARTIEHVLQGNLGDVRSSVDAINRTLTHLESIEEAVAKNKVDMVIGARLGTSEDRERHLQKSLGAMIENLHLLGRSTHWAKDVYREYLVDVIKNTSDNTDSLCQLTASAHRSNSRHITLISRAQRTDEILQKLMAKMQRGCKYSVISDVESWLDDQLEKFFDESRAAARRGVLIRRIFVVRDDEIRSGAFTPGQAFQELSRHLEDRSDSETVGYHIRLYDTSGPVKPQLSKARLELLREHFGIFEPARDEPCVQVEVERTNLSQLKLTNLSRLATLHKDFDIAWEALKPGLTTDALLQARTRWEQVAAQAAGPK